MFFKNTYPALLWAALILALTLSPAPDLPEATWITTYYVDKMVHVVLFAILYFLLMRGLLKQDRAREFYNEKVMWSVVTVILYGAATEILQSILPTGRSGELTDWLADGAGAGAGYMVYRRWYKQKSISA